MEKQCFISAYIRLCGHCFHFIHYQPPIVQHSLRMDILLESRLLFIRIPEAIFIHIVLASVNPFALRHLAVCLEIVIAFPG